MKIRPALPHLIVAVALPLVVYLAGALLVLAWLPELPAEVAIHWNSAGEVDGWASPVTYIVMLVVLGVGMAALFGAMAFAQTRQRRAPQRFLAGVSLGTAVFLTVMLTWMAGDQRHGGEPSSIGLVLSVALGAGILVGVVAGLLLPKAEKEPAAPGAEPLALAPEERAVWVRTVHAPLGFVLVFLGLVILMAVVLGTSIVAMGPRALGFGVVAAAILLLLVSTMSVKVRVDAQGLTARSILGLPRFRVRTADVKTARVTTISPLGDFGGWGFRWAGGKRFGVVMRGGEAIEVERHNGRILVVTVDDAETAAALLLAYAQRTEGRAAVE